MAVSVFAMPSPDTRRSLNQVINNEQENRDDNQFSGRALAVQETVAAAVSAAMTLPLADSD
jgi:hypothetical protein